MGTACSWGQYQHWNPDAGMLVTKGVTWPWRNELQRLIFSLHSWVCLHQVNGMLTHNRFWKLGKNIGWFFVIERVDLQYQKRECWVKPHFLRFEFYPLSYNHTYIYMIYIYMIWYDIYIYMYIPFHVWKHFQHVMPTSRWRLIHWVDRQAWRARMIPLQRPSEMKFGTRPGEQWIYLINMVIYP
jgi:hypothetical protein